MQFAQMIFKDRVCRVCASEVVVKLRWQPQRRLKVQSMLLARSINGSWWQWSEGPGLDGPENEATEMATSRKRRSGFVAGSNAAMGLQSKVEMAGGPTTLGSEALQQ